jgi:hypothetical protein
MPISTKNLTNRSPARKLHSEKPQKPVNLLGEIKKNYNKL